MGLLAIFAKAIVVELAGHGVFPSTPEGSENVNMIFLLLTDPLGTYISPPKTILGREECLAERFSKRSKAICASFSMMIVCPSTVMELIGPDD